MLAGVWTATFWWLYHESIIVFNVLWSGFEASYNGVSGSSFPADRSTSFYPDAGVVGDAWWSTSAKLFNDVYELSSVLRVGQRLSEASNIYKHRASYVFLDGFDVFLEAVAIHLVEASGSFVDPLVSSVLLVSYDGTAGLSV